MVLNNSTGTTSGKFLLQVLMKIQRKNYKIKKLEWSDFLIWGNKSRWASFEHEDLCEIDEALVRVVIMYNKIELGTKREYDNEN